MKKTPWLLGYWTLLRMSIRMKKKLPVYMLYGDNVFEKRGIRRDRTGGSGKGRYLQGKTGIL